MKIHRFLLLALVAAPPALGLDLKGVELGKIARPGEMKAAFDLNCTGRNRYCSTGFTQVAGVWVHTAVSTDNSGAVSKITLTFESSQFELLARAAIAKYGKPTDSRITPMQNGMGARVNVQDIWWDDSAGSRVWIIQCLGTLTEGQMVLESASSRDAAKAKEARNEAKSRM